MVRTTVFYSVIITVWLLLMCTALGNAQSGKRTPQDPRGVSEVPATPTAASLERRIALVIGNAAYQYTTPLKNPVHDAQDMARVLIDLQFQVILKTDVTLDAMAEAIFAFGERLKGGGVGLFYYSGHGMQVKGENYLIPIDTNVVREDDIKRKTINAKEILDKMDEAKSHLNLVFLDACRNNPFPRSVRAVSRGLAGMNAPTGTLLVFATNPDNVAADGTGRNGTYTKHLLQYITKPGLEVGMMLRKIRTAVKEETGGQQVPWENGSIEGEFYFTGMSGAPPMTSPTPSPLASQPSVSQTASVMPPAGSASPPPMTASTPPLSLVADAKKIVDALRKEQYSDVAQHFTEEMRQAVPVGRLQMVWRDMVARNGSYKTITTVRQQKREYKQELLDVVIMTVEFERARFDTEVSYNSNRQIAGLWFEPTTGTGYMCSVLSKATTMWGLARGMDACPQAIKACSAYGATDCAEAFKGPYSADQANTVTVQCLQNSRDFTGKGRQVIQEAYDFAVQSKWYGCVFRVKHF
jgi:hypothetical protein